MKATTKVATIVSAVILMVGIYTLAIGREKNPSERLREAVDEAISQRRVDPSVRLVTSYREVTERELDWFVTWHESDDIIFNEDEFVVFYNDTQKDADYVWIYQVN